MLENKPSYIELLNENILLKAELSEYMQRKTFNELSNKNNDLIEVNEELRQTFQIIAQNRDELEKSESKFRLLAENISDVIWMMDLNGNFTYVSPSAHKLFGYTKEELTSLSVKDILIESDYLKHRNAFFKRIEKEKNGQITESDTSDLIHIKKNRELFLAEIVTNPLRDNNNKLIGILGVTRDISSRKKIEEEIKKLSVVIEQSPASVVITDVNGRIEYVNNTFTNVTGYTPEEAIGKNPSILKSGKTPPETYRDLWNTILAGNVWKGEFINRKKNGEHYWEKVIIAPIKNSIGALTNFVSIKENITDKKNAELELIDSQERYKFLSDITTEGIIIHENEFILDVNESVKRITGYNNEDLVGLNKISKLFTDKSMELILSNISNNVIIPTEVIGIRKDNSIYPAEIESRPFKYKNKEIHVSALRDVTYRKRIEDVLRSSLKLNEIANSTEEVEIIAWGLEEAVRLSDSNIGYFHLVNDDQKTMSMQFWPKETLGKDGKPNDKFHWSIEENSIWADCFYSRKTVVNNDFSLTKHDTNPANANFPLIRFISIPLIEDDKVKIIFGVGNKNTNYNQFDVDILSLLAENIWIVIQRKRSENQLIEANSSKDKFFSIISHDLKSPIGSIQGLTEVMLENFDSIGTPELRHYIRTIHESSKMTYNLLDNMLLWAQSQRKKIEFNPISIDIEQVIPEVIQIYSYKAEKKNISIILNIEKDIKAKADINMFETIVRNLIANALKFTPKDGKMIIRASKFQKDFLIIQVKDSGIGIVKEKVPILNLFLFHCQCQ